MTSSYSFIYLSVKKHTKNNNQAISTQTTKTNESLLDNSTGSGVTVY